MYILVSGNNVIIRSKEEKFYYLDDLYDKILFEFSDYGLCNVSQSDSSESDDFSDSTDPMIVRDNSIRRYSVAVNGVKNNMLFRKNSLQVKINYKDMLEIKIDSRKYHINDLRNLRYERRVAVSTFNDPK